jgi:ADP-ribose pyrophosphatase YjhB (NUDIX family)
MERRPVVKVLALVRRPRDGALLVSEDVDPATGEPFHRPLGGSVEFREYALDAVVREIREELDAELTEVALSGVIENLFTYDGKPHHEIFFVFTGRLLPVELYERDDLKLHDHPGVRVRWRPARANRPRLVPEELTTFT